MWEGAQSYAKTPTGVSDSSCFAGTSAGNKAAHPAAGRAEVLCVQQGKDGSGLSTFNCQPGGTGMSRDEESLLTPVVGAVGKFKDVEQPGVPGMLAVVDGAGGR